MLTLDTRQIRKAMRKAKVSKRHDALIRVDCMPRTIGHTGEASAIVFARALADLVDVLAGRVEVERAEEGIAITQQQIGMKLRATLLTQAPDDAEDIPTIILPYWTGL